MNNNLQTKEKSRCGKMNEKVQTKSRSTYKKMSDKVQSSRQYGTTSLLHWVKAQSAIFNTPGHASASK